MDYLQALANASVISSINPQESTVLVLSLIILLVFSFILSGSEVAFFSLTYKDINLLKTKPQQQFKRIIDLLDQPKQLLASLLIANSFVNIGIIIISNILIDNLFNFEKFNGVWLEFIIKVVVVTAFLVLFGEVLPKVLATQNNVRFAKDTGAVVEIISYLFKGLSKWMVRNSDFIERKLTRSNNAAISLAELDHAIDLTTDSASAEKEKKILKGIIKFGNITVRQIMKARLDVHGVEKSSTFQELVAQISELHYSRLPVYEEELDKVIGMIHTKDVVPYLDSADDFDWHQLIRSPYFVHEQKLIEDLLKEFQAKRIHFAVVVDEFGGTSGIVTLEDILEEVIGDIRDEFDEEDFGYKKIDEYNYIFEGKTMINDVCKAMELNANTFDEFKGESDSIAGLVLEIAGEIPQAGTIISKGAFDFAVLEVEKNRLHKIKVTIRPEKSE